jgi:hypothetical protein
MRKSTNFSGIGRRVSYAAGPPSGAFAQSTILFSHENLTMKIAFRHEDDFLKNLICLSGELRGGLAVPVPAGSMTQAANGLHRLASE